MRPNYVVLRDRWGFVVDTFQIQRRRPIGQGDASYLEVSPPGKIAQLGDELVLQYEGAEVGQTIGRARGAAGLRGVAAPIALGVIDPRLPIELPFTLTIPTSTRRSAASACRWKEQRGRFYLDAKGKLQWRLAPR